MISKIIEKKLVSLQLVRGLSSSTARSARNNAFNTVITEEVATKSPQLVTLHNRLRLPGSFKLSTLGRCLTCIQKDNKYPNNVGLSIFGKNLLSYHATELLLMKYPRLPLNVLNNAINGIIGDETLYSIGKEWGIQTDSSTAVEKFLNEEPEEITIGRLRFDNQNKSIESNLTVIDKKNTLTQEVAMASAVKSIVGAYYASSKSLQDTKKFIYNYILTTRHLKIQDMFEFEQPTRELAALCKRQGLEQPVTRLLSESGRASKRPVFLVAVFSGNEKLGESFGASLREAKIRASVNALMNWYLYSSLDVKLPSDADYSRETLKEVDHGIVIV
ncbi:mitochondrial 54S ribosomal protein YmL3 [Saccharomycopsis crataegensis]|uniref:Large ribosomal subunit protein mL44 n=1 Tax=Saccharomycopsis crataegensis TaxID=43959 RepID=A0AAV5QUB6_9ASCO|nr:mitochondrial 54S ribosomal protein YmL3 [Saccharomycopsis crataegensis]